MPKRGFSCLKSQKELHRNAKRSRFERPGPIKGKKLNFPPPSQKLMRKKAINNSRNPNPINDGEGCMRFGNAPSVIEL